MSDWKTTEFGTWIAVFRKLRAARIALDKAAEGAAFQPELQNQIVELREATDRLVKEAIGEIRSPRFRHPRVRVTGRGIFTLH